MSTPPTFGTQLIGQTEKALNAILDRQLVGTALTEPQWVTLTIAVMSHGGIERDQLIQRTSGALRVSHDEAAARVDELTAAGLLEDAADCSDVHVTDAGAQLHGRIRGAVIEVTERLWGDLPGDDLATAARVLSTVLARANDELLAA